MDNIPGPGHLKHDLIIRPTALINKEVTADLVKTRQLTSTVPVFPLSITRETK